MPKIFTFFSSKFHCLRRTEEQRVFEERLFIEGLQREELKIVEKINQTIPSEELAVKFVLQELDAIRIGDMLNQDFTKKSGFHHAQYLGALEKFGEVEEELDKIQIILFSFLNKIANEKIMFQTNREILDRVMEYWEIGKYSEEGKLFIEEEQETPLTINPKTTNFSLKPYLKKIQKDVMNKLVTVDEKIQNLLDSYALSQKRLNEEKEEKKENQVLKEEQESKNTIYTEEKINSLMEEYSHIIEDVITGKIQPEHQNEVEIFKEHISLAAVEGNNLSFVFCAFFETKSSFSNLPVPINMMDDKSKMFLIQILNTFAKKGFSENLHDYFNKNRDVVYALATKNDMFMQYLIAFWYVWESEDKAKIKEEQKFWYAQSAANGFQPAIKKMKE
ncbi:MAG: hypothetical protein DSZ07_00475 [Sulfurovum sp.]|nr:MAG: hypothetical protein DSZ07_00475 [Sulfurovum sp.]